MELLRRDPTLEKTWRVDSLPKAHFLQGVHEPHSVLDENIVKTKGICMFSVALKELDPSPKLTNRTSHYLE